MDLMLHVFVWIADIVEGLSERLHYEKRMNLKLCFLM